MESANEESAQPVEVEESGALREGDTVGGRFVIDGELGIDTFGRVHRAVDQKSGKRIAILELDPTLSNTREQTDALRAAVKVATGLSHKNIVSVFGMGKEAKCRYVAREYVDGQSLAQLLDRKTANGKVFTLKGCYNVLAHICNALQYALPTMTHGVLRPTCILINRSGRVKIADFGLSSAGPDLMERRQSFVPWDRPFFDPAGAGDDVYAIGHLIYVLLVGTPATRPVPSWPEHVAALHPEALEPLLARAVDRTRDDRFTTPGELKAAFLKVLDERVKPTAPPPSAQPPHGSVEVLDAVPTAPPVLEDSAPQPHRPKRAPSASLSSGGFVVPDLKPVGRDDDGTTMRWLVERDGTDFGPFTRKQIVEDLFAEKIGTDAVLYDIETDQRLPLSEFPGFFDDLVAWQHEKAEREKQRAEAAVRAASRRRTRLLLGTLVFLVVVFGGGAGGWVWYQSTLPQPVPAHLGALVTTMSVALPAVPLPELLPETPAEANDRRQKASAAASVRRTSIERRQVAKEARLAASSELSVGAGDGARFDRPAFDRALSRRNGRLFPCLQAEARRRPGVGMTVKITVIPTGKLINVQLAGGSNEGRRCVRAALAGLSVPPFDGTNVKVSLPFSIQ